MLTKQCSLITFRMLSYRPSLIFLSNAVFPGLMQMTKTCSVLAPPSRSDPVTPSSFQALGITMSWIWFLAGARGKMSDGREKKKKTEKNPRKRRLRSGSSSCLMTDWEWAVWGCHIRLFQTHTHTHRYIPSAAKNPEKSGLTRTLFPVNGNS